MMNLVGIADQVATALTETPDLGIGIHLNLTYGTPIAGEVVPSLVDENGRFHSRDRWFEPNPKFNPMEVKLEWEMQIEAALDMGVQIDHIDSHHHIAIFREDLWQIFLGLALKYGCGVRPPFPIDVATSDLELLLPRPQLEFARKAAAELAAKQEIKTPTSFFASFFGRSATEEHLIDLITGLDHGISELMCHPGHTTPDLSETSGYARERDLEVSILTHPDIMNLIQSEGIELRTYRTAWGI
jgi:predicted glycoside hydrolase/deacetylase ChbG (UPF0249 family)